MPAVLCFETAQDGLPPRCSAPKRRALYSRPPASTFLWQSNGISFDFGVVQRPRVELSVACSEKQECEHEVEAGESDTDF
eukprot:3888-Heterococcus_DN1.PRE.1